MIRKAIALTCLLLNLLLILSTLGGAFTEVMAAALRVHHDLAIVLTPD